MRVEETSQPERGTMFVGLVEYLAQFMPDVLAYTTPLMSIQRNGHPFLW